MNKVIAGTEDGYLRIFKNDRLFAELKETDGVCAVAALSNQCFGYALADGTVGVYHKRTSLWKFKVSILTTAQDHNSYLIGFQSVEN